MSERNEGSAQRVGVSSSPELRNSVFRLRRPFSQSAHRLPYLTPAKRKDLARYRMFPSLPRFSRSTLDRLTHSTWMHPRIETETAQRRKEARRPRPEPGQWC